MGLEALPWSQTTPARDQAFSETVRERARGCGSHDCERLDRARVRLGQGGRSLSEVRAGPSSGADRVRIQAHMRQAQGTRREESTWACSSSVERTPHFDRGRRRMRSKSLVVDRELVTGKPAANESQTAAFRRGSHRALRRIMAGCEGMRGARTPGKTC